MSNRILPDRIEKRHESDHRDPGDYAAIHGFHAHVYFRNPRERDIALALREDIAKTHPESRLGRIHDRAIVVHTAPMYQRYARDRVPAIAESAMPSRNSQPEPPGIHGDLRRRASADTQAMEWTPSPSGSVWRKRVHLVGPPDSGQVTSVVRYEPDSTFPAHDHPDGEEILVLEGIFSDEHGDWPAGTYLLNPEGFRHAPFSKPGCLLFVKLRQYPGTDRRHVVIDTREGSWQPTGTPGIERQPLYEQAGYSDVSCLERWAPGTDPGEVVHADGAEIFVLEGVLVDEAGRFEAGSWLRLPVGQAHHPLSESGCTLYVKRGGLV